MDDPRLNEAVEAVSAYGARHPDSWAGCYLASDGALVVCFTRDVGAHQSALGALPWRRIRFRAVQHSRVELERFKTDVVEALEGSGRTHRRPQGPQIRTVVAVDDEHNQVSVVLGQDDPDREALTKTLTTRFGPAIRVGTR